MIRTRAGQALEHWGDVIEATKIDRPRQQDVENAARGRVGKEEHEDPMQAANSVEPGEARGLIADLSRENQKLPDLGLFPTPVRTQAGPAEAVLQQHQTMRQAGIGRADPDFIVGAELENTGVLLVVRI